MDLSKEIKSKLEEMEKEDLIALLIKRVSQPSLVDALDIPTPYTVTSYEDYFWNGGMENIKVKVFVTREEVYKYINSLEYDDNESLGEGYYFRIEVEVPEGEEEYNEYAMWEWLDSQGIE